MYTFNSCKALLIILMLKGAILREIIIIIIIEFTRTEYQNKNPSKPLNGA